MGWRWSSSHRRPDSPSNGGSWARGRKGGALMEIFAQWSTGATTFGWRSSTPANDGREVTVFTRRAGTPGAPALVCVHGFPTSSIDYYALAGELSDEFEIFALDFPGYGVSDKPPEPYKYSLYD